MSFTRSSLLVPLTVIALSLAACTSTPLPPSPALPVPPVHPIPPPVTALTPTPVPAPPAKPGPPQLVPATYAALPGWDRDDVRAAWPAFMSSCGVLVKKADWKEVCTIARSVNGGDEQAVRGFFEAFLVPNQVIAPDGASDGLITGYYEPLLHGARKKGGPYQTPLYKVPDDLITVDLASVYPELNGMRLRGRLSAKKSCRIRLVPKSTAPTHRARSCCGSTMRSRPSSCRCRAPAASN